MGSKGVEERREVDWFRFMIIKVRLREKFFYEKFVAIIETRYRKKKKKKRRKEKKKHIFIRSLHDRKKYGSIYGGKCTSLFLDPIF